MVEGGLPHGSGLLFHPGLYTRHRRAGLRGALAHNHHAHRSLDALRDVALLPARRRSQPARAGIDRHARELASPKRGKLFVLFLLGFVATAWLFTITLSASSATEQVAGNPLVPELLRDREVTMTLVLVAILGGVFLKGFRETITMP